MMNLRPRVQRNERDQRCDTFQDDKTFFEHITDYLNGNRQIDVSMNEGSFDFKSIDDVDFNADLTPTNHDVYDVASGLDKVFVEKSVTDPVSTPEPTSTPDPTPISDPS